jgi:Abnormal spindle-like microcephaly-assoc'd, ASPM-SPD-2-Hydin
MRIHSSLAVSTLVTVLFGLLVPMSGAIAQDTASNARVSTSVPGGKDTTATASTEESESDSEGTSAAPAPGKEAGAAARAASAASSSISSNPLSACFEWVKDHQACAIVFGVIVLLIVLVFSAALIAAGKGGVEPHIPHLVPSFFFWLGIGYLLLLLTIGAFYVQIAPKGPPLLLGGVLPAGVPWFGALGAVVISLEGVFAFGQKGWDPKYNYWHIGRPLFGAVLGVVAFFTYVLIVMSSGSAPSFLEQDKAPSSAAKDYIVYYVVAFLVGYREETFRELIRRVTDLILKPGTPSADDPAVTFRAEGAVITSWDFGTVAAGSSAMVTVEMANSGKGTLKSPGVTLMTTGVEFTTANDRLSGIGELKPGEAKSIDIKFSPAGTGGFTGVLTVTGSNLITAAKLQLSGKA